ncbi:MAG: glutamate--tRNA ligase [Candidatus Dependentiae bacterium]|nr:glutamate--tRNA ligase [Candidatus Dependentiae bacterium]
MKTDPFPHVRVRFAPSPTGWMHLGNARIALINALFAKKYQGTFILRIEDTDQSRNVDPRGVRILEDLKWLQISIDEGPYYQSERHELYQSYLQRLIDQQLVYRCFETNEELELKRQRQLARGLPPKYDRAGLKLSTSEVAEKLAAGTPFVWRLRLPSKTVSINDIAHGTMTFDLEHFSDVAVTRQDGSCTFLFANCIDDIEMKVSHVLRGADHLTNTAVQAALYELLDAPKPTFYHMPLVCNAQGKKLSKREFGSSLEDFKGAGFIAEGLCNYLAIIGSSFAQEIMDFEELAHALHFDESSPKGCLQFDPEKLRWVDHKWLQRLSLEEVVARALPFFERAYPAAKLSNDLLMRLIGPIKSDLTTLSDAITMLTFFFVTPTIEPALLEAHAITAFRPLFAQVLEAPITDGEALLAAIKAATKAQGQPLKEALTLVRIALTGEGQGIGIADLFAMLGLEEVRRRMAVLA